MNEKKDFQHFFICFLLFIFILSGCKSVQPDNTSLTDSIGFISGEISTIISEIDVSTERTRSNIRDAIQTGENASGELQFIIDCLQRYESEVSDLLEAFNRTRSELEALKKDLSDFINNTDNNDYPLRSDKSGDYLPEV